ncbi:unnamed protein product [Ophioblennius macclurei]
MARCIGNNTLEIVPYECPTIQEITCTNDKKPILVYDEYHCCQHYVCDCVCEGWGDPHYVTFDGLYYSFQGECTYVLMKEINPRFHLEIYINNVLCDPNEDVSCPRSISVKYGFQEIKMINRNLNGAPQLEVLGDQGRLKLPYSQKGVIIKNTGVTLVLKILRLEVVVKFGRTGFSVHLPFQYFGRNTQGHCGTCTNNQADDCMLPGGQLVGNCAAMAGYWGVEDNEKANCTKPPALPTATPEPEHEHPCRDDSICDLLTNEDSPFAECHELVSPANFYRGCSFDSCLASDPAFECTSLEMYAAACAQAGVCIYWRNFTKLCESDCPANKIYKPCGPVEEQTCEDEPIKDTMNFTTEGCFCPEGMKLFNRYSNICVEKCGCLDSEGKPREFGEKFEHGCQDCICEDSKTVTCKPKACPTPSTSHCTATGFVLVNQTSQSDPCCMDHVCQCQFNTCPVSKMSCSIGYQVVTSVPEGKCCPEHTCKPKRVCVAKGVEYPPGSSVPGGVCETCTCARDSNATDKLLPVNCETQKCKEQCSEGYEYAKTDTDQCCGRCVQTQCVIKVKEGKTLLEEGQTWSPPGNRCELYTCVRKGDSLTPKQSTITCPPFVESNCHPDTIQTAADGCCKTCMEKQQTCRLMPMKTNITLGDCTSIHEVDVPYCEGSCNTFTKFSPSAHSLQHSCSCCKEMRTSDRYVDLICKGKNTRLVDFQYKFVEECGCSRTDCLDKAGLHGRKRRSFTPA